MTETADNISLKRDVLRMADKVSTLFPSAYKILHEFDHFYEVLDGYLFACQRNPGEIRFSVNPLAANVKYSRGLVSELLFRQYGFSIKVGRDYMDSLSAEYISRILDIKKRVFASRELLDLVIDPVEISDLYLRGGIYGMHYQKVRGHQVEAERCRLEAEKYRLEAEKYRLEAERCRLEGEKCILMATLCRDRIDNAEPDRRVEESLERNEQKVFNLELSAEENRLKIKAVEEELKIKAVEEERLKSKSGVYERLAASEQLFDNGGLYQNWIKMLAICGYPEEDVKIRPEEGIFRLDIKRLTPEGKGFEKALINILFEAAFITAQRFEIGRLYDEFSKDL
ncbi:hypothetical protein ACUH90_03835 [Dermabacteraceae bacterium P7054]